MIILAGALKKTVRCLQLAIWKSAIERKCQIVFDEFLLDIHVCQLGMKMNN